MEDKLNNQASTLNQDTRTYKVVIMFLTTPVLVITHKTDRQIDDH